MKNVDNTVKKLVKKLNAAAEDMGSVIEFVLPHRQGDGLVQVIATHPEFPKCYVLSVMNDYTLKVIALVNPDEERTSKVLYFDGRPILHDMMKDSASCRKVVMAVGFHMMARELGDKELAAVRSGVAVTKSSEELMARGDIEDAAIEVSVGHPKEEP